MKNSILKSIQNITEISEEISAIAFQIEDLSCSSQPISKANLYRIRAQLTAYADQLSIANDNIKQFAAHTDFVTVKEGQSNVEQQKHRL